MKFLRNLLALVAVSAACNALAAFEECKDLFPTQQIPVTSQVGRDLCFDSFAIYYSPRDKKPIYTVEKLNKEGLSAPHPRRTNQFYEEARLPFSERALLSDYRGSGYDRGHNAPAGDMNNERSMAQSFSLANMMPQARQNNQGIWAKNVEEPTRAYVKRAAGDVYVFTGSVGNSGSIGRGQVTIPSYLYKLVYDPNKNEAWAYWVENTNEARMSPPISYSELVQKTGIDFHLPVDRNSNKPSLIASEPIKIKSQKQLLGGWYPVFFDEYVPSKLNDVINNIKSGKVASIQVQYDRNEALAKQIAAQVESQTKLQPSLTQSSPPESSTATYERNRVTLIVRSK
ncbi:DNA/RNA non-specific endonuclease [Polynucleobacter sp. JS-Polo-80-F4]|uniref:DNA/RNA non-specific endonuclease n=1 Tax=Polynucleobacter sp. JS-Polo-80-F4 TaxID=2576918 RepID=UPI001C0A9B96|nr:DNA/RNA non-specific endonuclease [Polynucleobacter sp. JS-Polo-80-F4]MBU3616792.1 DNA/RNA non-specific endonuclease [Polynucleobacter sp. JS-Polo-80-F4]